MPFRLGRHGQRRRRGRRQTDRDHDAGASVELDANDLAYILCAGLRVVLGLVKSVGVLTVTNANAEVYEIFEMTGFAPIFGVRRAPREISLEGLEQIGEGATAKVYRLDPDAIVKAYNPGMRIELVEADSERRRAAFLAGSRPPSPTTWSRSASLPAPSSSS